MIMAVVVSMCPQIPCYSSFQLMEFNSPPQKFGIRDSLLMLEYSRSTDVAFLKLGYEKIVFHLGRTPSHPLPLGPFALEEDSCSAMRCPGEKIKAE